MTVAVLKLIAVLSMTIDHIGVFISNTPIWFNWIGRLAAPIFIFSSVLGFSYTSNRKSYIKRLYFSSIGMAFIQFMFKIENNFFRVLFCLNVGLYLITLYQEENKNCVKIVKLYFLYQLISIGVISGLLVFGFNESFAVYILPAILGSVFNLEGGIIFLLLGLLIYLVRESKIKLTILYSLFCMIYLIFSATPLIPIILGKMRQIHLSTLSDVLGYILDTTIGLPPMHIGGSIFNQNYQWMMIAALPFILLYNEREGRKNKWFYYFYYPMHIMLLFFLGNFFN